MSFLDNLESSLKSLESAEERAADKPTQEQRDKQAHLRSLCGSERQRHHVVWRAERGGQ